MHKWTHSHIHERFKCFNMKSTALLPQVSIFLLYTHQHAATYACGFAFFFLPYCEGHWQSCENNLKLWLFFSFKNLHSYSYKIFDWTKAMSYLLCWAMCELPLNFIIFIAWNDYQKSCNFFFQRKAGLMLATRQTMLNQQMLNLASIVHLVCDCKQQMPLKMQTFYIHSYRQTSFCV